jgi:translation elongation factor EF-1beta
LLYFLTNSGKEKTERVANGVKKKEKKEENILSVQENSAFGLKHIKLKYI